MASDNMSHHKALVLEDFESGFSVTTVPTPTAASGEAIIRIVAAGIISYHREIYSGSRGYSFPTPIVGGTSAIGRIFSVGPDATLLRPGQLVFIDCFIRSRDDTEVVYLSSIHDSGAPGGKQLMRNVWRDGAFAEFAKFPIENCHVLDENILCGSLGYEIPDLAYMHWMLVAYGGLRDIGLQPGETVVVAPATAGYGGAGVLVALAMGARAIALGRNEDELRRLKSYLLQTYTEGDVEVMKISGDEAADTATLRSFGVIDAVLDLSPPQAAQSTHLRSATTAMRRKGRVSMMGFNSIPYDNWTFLGKDGVLKGKLMYEREDVVQFVKLMERGKFPRGGELVKTKVFGLEKWKEALDEAAGFVGVGRQVVFTP